MKRSKHSLSHFKLGTCDMGQLIPISWYEVLPGDTVQQATSVFLRFAPMVAPVMTPVRVQLWTFYVPNRLLWSKWEDFRTGGSDGLDTSTPPFAKFTNGTLAGSLSDYLGVPPGTTDYFSMLPVRAYYQIYKEFFRDQDLVDDHLGLTDDNYTKFVSDADSGKFSLSSGNGFNLMPLAWEKDYFTTARPWPQKGLAVTVPVNGVSGSQSITISANGTPTFQPINTTNILEGSYGLFNVNHRSPDDNLTGPLSGAFQKDEAGNITNKDLKWGNPALAGTLTNSSQGIGSVNLDDLREAFALQRFQEARAMYGSRYTEYLRYLGVKSSDARLQRPEYLGGIRNTVQFSEVLQTAADGDNPVGTLRGHGVAATRSKRFRRFIEEDGIVMTLMGIRPIALYSQGLYRGFSRETKEDYWTKELQHIGQQEVYTKELYSTADPDTVFGYQNRYDEYRQIPSTVCGLFRSTLDYWHLGRVFANEPVLNSSFIQGSPTKRVFAEQTQNEIYFMASNSIQARRIMSKDGTPLN